MKKRRTAGYREVLVDYYQMLKSGTPKSRGEHSDFKQWDKILAQIAQHRRPTKEVQFVHAALKRQANHVRKAA